MNLTKDFLNVLLSLNISDRKLNETLKRLVDHYAALDKTAPGYQAVYPEECQTWMYLVDMLYWYYVPAVILIGLIGNLLSCFVFLYTHLKLRSSSYYLAALSAADFGFLASISLVWLNNKLDVPVFNRDGWCQLMVYVSSVCSFLSVWLIVAFTVERFIAVQYPLHRPRVCTVSRAKATVIVLSVASLLVHSYTFLTAGIIRTSDGDVCELRESYHELMRVINILDTVITLIIPIGMIITMNTMITRNLIHFSDRFRRDEVAKTSDRTETVSIHIMQSTSSNNSNGGRRSYPVRMTAVNGNSFHSTPNNSRLPSNSSHHQYEMTNVNGGLPAVFQPSKARCIQMRASCGNLMSTRTQQNITKMLLLVSTVFILLNLPSYLIRLYIFFRFSIWHEETPQYLWCTQQMFMLLYYTNFSINFLLYNMYGITFRRCFFQLIRNTCKHKTTHLCCICKPM